MRKINLFLLLIIISAGVYAQDSLYFTRNTYIVDRLNVDTSFTIVDSLYNPTPGIVTNVRVNFGARLNGTTILTPAQFSSDSVVNSDTLYPFHGNDKRLAFHINNGQAPFLVGPNGVVIWPIIYVNNTFVASSPFDSIYINTYYYPLDIKESPLAKMYIFQSGGQLNIVFGDAENVVQQVRIYDIIGQGIYSGSPDRSKNIPTAGWNTGIYLCEVITYSGERKTFKFKVE